MNPQWIHKYKGSFFALEARGFDLVPSGILKIPACLSHEGISERPYLRNRRTRRHSNIISGQPMIGAEIAFADN